MSEYLLLIDEDEPAHAAQSPAEIAALIAARARFADELRGAGQLVEHGRLRPSAEGKRVRCAPELRVEDGPFSPALAGFVWVDVATIDEATRLAAAYPVLASDTVDVRPVMKGLAVPGKDHRPGKTFVFGVLGGGGSEEAWTQVMDRIDAETHHRFPPNAFLGGNRLHLPRRAMFDGPFLESKEVIGGVFFLRMLAIEDAVRWAAGSRFVVHGALEIRELWRS
jgi:hypothetical protein